MFRSGHMQSHESLSNAKRVLNESRQTTDTRAVHEAKRNRRRRNGNGKGNAHNNDDDNGGRPTKRVKFDSPESTSSGNCPLCKDKKNVKRHVWADCFQNVNNPNSPIVKKLLATSSGTAKPGTNPGKGSTNRNSHEQHVVETPDLDVLDIDTTDRKYANCREGCLHDDDFSDIYEMDAVDAEKLQQQQRLDPCVAFRMAEHLRVSYGIMSRRGHH